MTPIRQGTQHGKRSPNIMEFEGAFVQIARRCCASIEK
jgi:hypothetical protein